MYLDMDSMTRVSRPLVAKRIYRTTATRDGEGRSETERTGGRKGEGREGKTRIVPSLRSPAVDWIGRWFRVHT